MKQSQPAEIDSVRADKWLWAARFYKTRSLAMEAINGGKVHLDGQRIKPARKLVIGDCLTLQKGEYTFAISIKGLALRRGPAGIARTLYSETEESIKAREVQKEERRLQSATGEQQQGRPDKRTRRKIHQFKSRELK